MPALAPIYVNTKKAAELLGYGDLDRFYADVKLGYIAGAFRPREGIRPRWRYVVAELAYVGPVYRPSEDTPRREAEARRAAELVLSEAEWRPRFTRAGRAARSSARAAV